MFAALPACKNASASTAATAATPQIDPKIEAAAKEWFHRSQSGNVDRSRLSDSIRGQLTAPLVRKIGAYLKPLGEPSAFTFLGSQHAEGATIYVFALTFSPGKLIETYALDTNGKVAGIAFKPTTSIDLKGSDVEQAITTGLVPFVQSQNWKLPIGDAMCPDHIDLSQGPGHCTLPVGGVALPIHVIYDIGLDKWRTNFDGSLYASSEVETSVETQMQSTYGVSTKAQCDMPVATTLEAGALIHCGITGVQQAATITLKTLPDGKDGFYLYPVPGLTNVLPFVDTATAAHNGHVQVLLTGAQLETFVDRWVSTEGLRGASRSDFGKARCPASVDLTGAKNAICLVSIDRNDLRYKVWIDDEGFEVSVLDAAMSKPDMEQFVINAIKQQLPADQSAMPISVNCGDSNVIVAPAPGSFSCSVRIGSAKGKAHVVVENNNGTIHLDGVQMDDDKSAHRGRARR